MNHDERHKSQVSTQRRRHGQTPPCIPVSDTLLHRLPRQGALCVADLTPTSSIG